MPNTLNIDKISPEEFHMDEQINKFRQLTTKSNTFLILIIIFHVILNIVWHKMNTAPPTWDSAGHLGLSFLFADKLPQLFLGKITLKAFLQISNYYPPLVQFLGGLLIIIFKRSYFSAIFIGTAFLAVSILYIFKIIMHFFNDPRLATLTVFIYSIFPHVWEQSRQFHLDVPLVALLLMAYYYLVKSNALKDKRNSLIFFILFTLAQLTKWYAFVYLIVPFVVEVVLKVVREKRTALSEGRSLIDIISKERLENTGIGSLIVLIFALPWYIANYSNIVNIFAITSTGEVGDPENVLSLESFFHYLKLIMSHQITFISVVLIFISIYLMARKKVVFNNYLFSLMIVPYLVFALIQNKDLRYVLPLTPIFALYISYLFLNINIKINKYLAGFYITFLMVTFFFMSFNQLKMLPEKFKFYAYMIGGPYYHGWYYEPYVYAANTQDWRVDEIIKEVEKLAKEDDFIQVRYRVLELSDNRYYSLAAFEMFRRQNDFEDMEIIVPYFQFDPFPPVELSEYISKVHFALVPSDPGPSGLRNIAVLNQLSTYFTSDQNVDFSLVQIYKMPDGNELSLYKRGNYVGYIEPTKKESSLRISVDRMLFFDREKIGGLQFKVFLYDYEGRESVVDVIGGGSQRRIALEGIQRFKIDLPVDQQDIRDIRGWIFEDGVFFRDENYKNIVMESGNEFIYEGKRIVPRSEYGSFVFRPKSMVRYDGEGITISLEEAAGLEDKVFVAYAVTGWQWNNIWLEGDNRVITIPTEGLVQVEVSQVSQLIVGLPDDWGFFPCYQGKAICFYPVVGGL